MKNPPKLIAVTILSLLGYAVAVSADLASPQNALSPSSTAQPDASVQSQPKFSEMKVQDRNAILNEIGKQDVTAIMQSWINAGRAEHDSTKQLMIRSLLVGAIRQKTAPDLLAQMKAFIADGSNTVRERQGMIAVVGGAATLESESLLIDETRILANKDLRDSAIGELGRLGESKNENLTPALEQLWTTSHDQQLLGSVAKAMAGIGKTSSIQMLLDASFGPQDKDNRKGAAFGALDDIDSSKAVPPLATLFNKSAPGTLEFQMSGDILVKIGDAPATQAIISRLKNLDDIDPAQVKKWTQDAQTTTLRKALTAAADPSVPFRNDKIRQIIQTTLEEHNRSRAANQQTPPVQQ